jgi:hypothetical protein
MGKGDKDGYFIRIEVCPLQCLKKGVETIMDLIIILVD